jgi:hypothetical protein
MERKVGVILNPSSGRGGAGGVRPWLQLRLGERLDLCEVQPGVDVAAWARSRAAADLERLLVIGGDGTFRSIAAALLGFEVPVGLVATGTNNNIAAVLGLPANPYEAAEVALAGEPQWISAGRVGDYVWALDRGGPRRRGTAIEGRRDFRFVQEADRIPGYEAWWPGYNDYLHTAFLVSLTFSVSNMDVLSHRAKNLTMLQALISVVVLAVIVARAINSFAG